MKNSAPFDFLGFGLTLFSDLSHSDQVQPLNAIPPITLCQHKHLNRFYKSVSTMHLLNGWHGEMVFIIERIALLPISVSTSSITFYQSAND